MRRWLIGVFVLLTICNAVPAHAAESLEQTIAFLLHRIETADATFIRNGQAHTPQEAVMHVRAKYRAFQRADQNAGGFYPAGCDEELAYGPALPRAHSRWSGDAAQHMAEQRTPGTSKQ